MDPTLIREELEILDFPINKITQLISYKTKLPLPLYQICLENIPKSKEIFKLNSLAYFSTTVEKFNSRSITKQCHRCQYFFHTAHTCKMTPRCVKCAQNHDSRECTYGKGKINAENVKCCNCGENHIASFRGCKNSPANRKTDSNTATKPTPHNRNKTFADIVSGKNPTNISPEILLELGEIKTFKTILQEIANELGVNSFMEIISKFRSLLQKIKKASSPVEKLMIFAEGLE